MKIGAASPNFGAALLGKIGAALLKSKSSVSRAMLLTSASHWFLIGPSLYQFWLTCHSPQKGWRRHSALSASHSAQVRPSRSGWGSLWSSSLRLKSAPSLFLSLAGHFWARSRPDSVKVEFAEAVSLAVLYQQRIVIQLDMCTGKATQEAALSKDRLVVQLAQYC